MSKNSYARAGLAALLVCSGFALVGNKTVDKSDKALGKPFAKAELESKSGSSAKGTVDIRRTASGISVSAVVSGVTPPGKHGIHIHEKGDCSAPDASSAGGHFNPLSKPHAGPNHTESHIGDLGNIEIDQEGNGTLHVTMEDVHYNLKELGGWEVILGKAVIIHEKADDLKTQPTGNAGGRIACGILTAVKSAAE